MPDRPLLILPRPALAPRSRRGGGGAGFTRPTAAQQQQRLDARFREIADSFQTLQANVQGLDPDQVIVLETIGPTVAGVAQAASQIPGMEWMAELDLGEVPPEHGFAAEDDPTKQLGCRLYAVFTSQQAMDKLISLWDQWCHAPDERARRGFGPFKNLFLGLRDVRRWNAEDRIAATGLLDYFQERLQYDTGDIRFEVELWCRGAAERRAQAYEDLSGLLLQAGGRVISQSVVPEILYHGVLAALPAPRVQETVAAIVNQNYTQLLRCEAVMFFRPFGQARTGEGPGGPPPPTLRERLQALPPAAGEPVVALLDGLPFERHVALRDRLVIDDPDDFAARYEARQQEHGTAMGTLIVHGDLNQPEPALATPVYVRPIFIPVDDFHGSTYEVTPDDTLLVDLIHRAVRRLFEGDGANPPAAPSVKVINLSLGNRFQPFDREISPLARLLDWLAWKYKVLFVVSAGNCAEPITMAVSAAEWGALDEQHRREATLLAIRDTQVQRRILSPSEAVNVVTVGAVHADATQNAPLGQRVDLLAGARLPSPINPLASGYRRSLKPEILLPGGRQLHSPRLGNPADPATFEIASSVMAPGQLVGAPGQQPLEVDRTLYCRGTSNGTALASRCAARIHEALLGLRAEPGGELLENSEWAVLLKCLLVHGADWGPAPAIIESVFHDAVLAANGGDARRAAHEMMRLKTRFLGYGEVQPERCIVSTDERVTLVGASHLSADEAHLFEIPLPPALSGVRVERRLTVTLAWLTPFNLKHQAYRRARLWFDVENDTLRADTADAAADPARRGTVEHRVFTGRRAVALAEGQPLRVRVNCMADAGSLEEAVPYALALTLEVTTDTLCSVSTHRNPQTGSGQLR
jgi:hypothetical protein